MRFLLDENLSPTLAAGLQEAGHDALQVALLAAGADDSTVMRLAIEREAVLVSLDADYGELLFRQGGPAPPGVVFFRMRGRELAWQEHQMLQVLLDGTNWLGHYWVIEQSGLRRRLPLNGSPPAALQR